MTSEAIVRVVVFDERMYAGNGLVRLWMDKIVARFTAEAKHYAPVRTGVLREGIGGGVSQIGPRQLQGVIESTAPYSQFVLGGTVGPIMTTKARAGMAGAFVEREIYRLEDGSWTFTPTPGVFHHQISVPQAGYFMPIKAHGPWRKRFALFVRGQEANNFLIRAWAATARDHSSIRGINIPRGVRFPTGG